MRTKWLQFLTVAILIFGIFGCQQTKVQRYTRGYGFGPPYWEKLEVALVGGTLKRKLDNVSFSRIDDNRVKVSGSITNTFETVDVEALWHNNLNPHINNRFHITEGRDDNGTRFVNRRLNTWRPKRIMVYVCNSSEYIDVDNDTGVFNGIVTVHPPRKLDHPALKLPDDTKYVKWKKFQPEKTYIQVSPNVREYPALKIYIPNRPDKYGLFGGDKSYWVSNMCKYLQEFNPYYWMPVKEIDKAKSFAVKWVEDRICVVEITTKEQITRRIVSPEITVTPINTKKQLHGAVARALNAEFEGDKELLNAGMDAIKDRLQRPLVKRRKEVAQSLSFCAWAGHKYKIETVHGEYYYFNGFITPNANSIKKTILLVEKGDKIRIQGVREGEGGVIVDD